jgi:hypothetical protein
MTSLYPDLDRCQRVVEATNFLYLALGLSQESWRQRPARPSKIDRARAFLAEKIMLTGKNSVETVALASGDRFRGTASTASEMWNRKTLGNSRESEDREWAL